jgi:hypothetical protein
MKSGAEQREEENRFLYLLRYGSPREIARET